MCWANDNGLYARRTGRNRKPGKMPPARAVINLQTSGLGANADPGGGNPVLLHIQAMQWWGCYKLVECYGQCPRRFESCWRRLDATTQPV